MAAQDQTGSASSPHHRASQQGRGAPGAYAAIPHSRPSPPTPSMRPSYPNARSVSGPALDPYGAPELSAPISLPPIRSLDAQPQLPAPIAGGPSRYSSHLSRPASPALQQLQQQQPVPPLRYAPADQPGSAYYTPLPPPSAGGAAAAHQMGFGTPVHQQADTPFGLAPQGPHQRTMSGGRHKKEIKRRTKTGCLTCRRRRIKCDEGQPTCRNCQKSKRECLGYDPIFKQQSSPTPLQPAPSPSSQAGSAASASLPPAPAYATVSRHYAAPSGDFGASPAQQSGQPLGLYSTVDPAPARNPQQQPSRPAPLPGFSFPWRRMRIEDLMSVNGHAPPSLPPVPDVPLTEAAVDEVRLVYLRNYAPGLDKLLETDWYSQRGWPRLLQNLPLLHLLDQLLQRFAAIGSHDFAGIQATRSLETVVVWRLLSLVRLPHAHSSTPDVDESRQLLEAGARLDVLEALLTNNVLPRNPLLDVHYDPQLHETKHWQVEFWRLLGQFVAPAPAPAAGESSQPPQQQPSADATLHAARNILAMLENRDVLYSAMVCRLLGPALPDWPGGVGEAHNSDPNDPRTKVCVAKKFIEDEAAGKGTDQVVQRICDMVVSAWHVGR